MACLGLDATGPASPAATTLVIPVISVPIRWHVAFFGPVNSHPDLTAALWRDM